mmetsp:Transcript_1932/g.6291  ORF Transcript_1932/g.6291 Transcript_1932/m.6291 type:complete len:255 (-) Transcript_1932:69-833(-)
MAYSRNAAPAAGDAARRGLGAVRGLLHWACRGRRLCRVRAGVREGRRRVGRGRGVGAARDCSQPVARLRVGLPRAGLRGVRERRRAAYLRARRPAARRLGGRVRKCPLHGRVRGWQERHNPLRCGQRRRARRAGARCRACEGCSRGARPAPRRRRTAACGCTGRGGRGAARGFGRAASAKRCAHGSRCVRAAGRRGGCEKLEFEGEAEARGRGWRVNALSCIRTTRRVNGAQRRRAPCTIGPRGRSELGRLGQS